MPIWFNTLLVEAGLDPGHVRLLRHETTAYRGQTPYTLWRDDRDLFERYQSTQDRNCRGYFRGTHWASFVVPPDGRTLFVGLYRIALLGNVPLGWRHPLADRELDPHSVDLYETRLCEELQDLIGRLAVAWGSGTRSWRQLAGRQNKPVIELSRELAEPEFPGFIRFVARLSEVESMPRAWKAALSSVGGVYLLTCPRTREQYVGRAAGADGFLGRWRSYFGATHGGNVALKSREPSDYQVAILEVAGSAATTREIDEMEALWKLKMQSREMGLNRN